jgi:hypothetical protein
VKGVGDLVQMIEDGWASQVLSDRAIEISSGAVCGLYRAYGDDERRFLGCASKPRSMICQWFGLKIIGMVFSGLASKPVVTVFFGLTLKPMATVSPVWPPNRWRQFLG